MNDRTSATDFIYFELLISSRELAKRVQRLAHDVMAVARLSLVDGATAHLSEGDLVES